MLNLPLMASSNNSTAIRAFSPKPSSFQNSLFGVFKSKPHQNIPYKPSFKHTTVSRVPISTKINTNRHTQQKLPFSKSTNSTTEILSFSDQQQPSTTLSTVLPATRNSNTSSPVNQELPVSGQHQQNFPSSGSQNSLLSDDNSNMFPRQPTSPRDGHSAGSRDFNAVIPFNGKNLPRYNGLTSAEFWLDDFETRTSRFPDDMRLCWVEGLLEDKASRWYANAKALDPFYTWGRFRERFLAQFGRAFWADHLTHRLQRTIQAPGQSVRDFVQEIVTLIRLRDGVIDKQRVFNIVRSGLTLPLAKIACRKRMNTIEELYTLDELMEVEMCFPQQTSIYLDPTMSAHPSKTELQELFNDFKAELRREIRAELQPSPEHPPWQKTSGPN